MPYKSEAEKERELERATWMLEAEAFAHICRAENCNEAEAHRQFDLFIADHPGVVRRKPWGQLTGGLAETTLGLPPPFKPRMVLRSAVESTWPLPSAAEREAPSPTRTPYSPEAFLLWWKIYVPQCVKECKIPKRGGAKPGDEDEAWEAAKEVFSGVPIRAIRQARADPALTPDDWRTRGRRPRKK
jgi:hypothetical protein